MIDWNETVQKLDINPSQRAVAGLMELQTHKPPYFVFRMQEDDFCLLSAKFLTELGAALSKEFGGLVHVMVGHEGTGTAHKGIVH